MQKRKNGTKERRKVEGNEGVRQAELRKEDTLRKLRMQELLEGKLRQERSVGKKGKLK